MSGFARYLRNMLKPSSLMIGLMISLMIGLSLIALACLIVWPDVALAHDCSGPQDCEQTAGYNAVVSIVGAIAAIIAGIVGSTFSSTAPGIVAGTSTAPITPPPEETGEEAGEEAGEETGEEQAGPQGELPPGSDGWVVTDTDGKEHIFATQEEANDCYERLKNAAEQEAAQEHTRQLENDYKNAAEQVAFIDSVIQGLKNAGRDTTDQQRELDRWRKEQDRLRGEVGKAGGDTDYKPRDRSAWTFGEHDEMVAKQKDTKKKLETVHKMAAAIRHLWDKDMVGENPNLTEKMQKHLEKMSDQIVNGKDKNDEPSWKDIDKLKQLIRKDMDATASRNEVKNSNWVKDGAQNTAREVFTGQNSDGETSYKAMVLRGLMAAATGGQSEIPMEVIEKTYGMHDDVMAGKSGTEALKNAIKRVVMDELTGRAVEGGLNKIGKGAGKIYDAALDGTDLDKAIRQKLKSAGDVLNTDVKDVKKLFGGKGDEIADGIKVRAPKDHVVESDFSHRGKNGGPDAPKRDFDQRNADFERGRAAGEQKVKDLEEAIEYRKKNPNAPDADARVKNAVDDVQADKHAMHKMNERGGPDAPSETISEFNKDLKTSYESAHQTTRERIAQEYGVPVEDVKVVKPTNTPGGDVAPADPRGFAKRPDGSVDTNGADFKQRPPDSTVEVNGEKASFDQDVTYRVKQKNVVDPRTGKVEPEGFVDVPKDQTGRVYNEEFYKSRHNGELPTDPATGKVDTAKVNKYAEDMDQACTDRLDAEAYGNGDADLQTAVKSDNAGRDFDDVGGVGKTMEHKNYEWQNKAAETRDKAFEFENDAKRFEAEGNTTKAQEARAEADKLHQKAEAEIEEGYRQTTKQMQNQIEKRVEAVNQKFGPGTAEVPPKLKQATGIMQDPKLSPAEVEKKLAQMGYTPDKVVQQMSSNLESLQKFKPTSVTVQIQHHHQPPALI